MAARVYSISPSQQFRGNDGNWSTFVIQVGNPPKPIEVLPATSGRSVWVVNTVACGTEQDPTDQCPSTRGQLFDPNRSSSWMNISQVTNEYYGMNFGPEMPLNALLPAGLNYTGTAIPGTDRLAFGIDSDSDAPVLDDQLIAVYANVVPYVGVIGLSNVNETVLTATDTHFSVLGAFQNASRIDHAYYGYTAGASYKDRSTFYNLGSLTFGGYDASLRDMDNVLRVPMAQGDSNRTLVVRVQGMSLGDGGQTQNVNLGIPVLIDSVVPEIWLPEAGYTAIQDKFGLTWDNTTRRYLVDDLKHDDLMRRNVSITFSLAADASSTDTLDITLPYGALQPEVAWPIYDVNDTNASMRYFPVRRASSEDQFYLGRTFLQEAYLAADYDQQEFYVSQAIFRNANADEDLRAVGSHNGGLSGGAIAGIVIGVVAALAIAAGLLWFFLRKRKDKSTTDRKSAGSSSYGGTTEIDQWNEGVTQHEPKEQAMEEHYKPMLGPMELSGDARDHPTPELDAHRPERNRSQRAGGVVSRVSERSTGFTPIHRHELSAGSIRRTSEQSRTSVSTMGIVSPLDERTRARRRQTRSDSIGMPSPPSGHPSSEQRFGTPSPQLSDVHLSPHLGGGMGWHSGPVPTTYELLGDSRDNSSAATPAASEYAEPTTDEGTLQRLEGSGRSDSRNGPAELQTPVVAQQSEPTAYESTLQRLEGSGGQT